MEIQLIRSRRKTLCVEIRQGQVLVTGHNCYGYQVIGEVLQSINLFLG